MIVIAVNLMKVYVCAISLITTAYSIKCSTVSPMFMSNLSLIICGNNDMMQRERPEAFVNGETEHIAQNTEFGTEVMKEATTAHYERVNRAA